MLQSLLVSLLLAVATPYVHAEESVPLDQPYLGQLSLAVDLSQASLKIYRIKETIPVKPGALSLHYPKWIPGEHVPSGPIENVVGLVITGNGQKLAWRRDLRDMYTVHLQVPEGVRNLDLAFQFLSPGNGSGMFAGAGTSTTPELAAVEFNQVAFYPAGYYSRQIQIQPTVTLPSGWHFASALQVERSNGNVVAFRPVSFNNLVDSPLIAGDHFKSIDLNPGGAVPTHLNMVADSADDLKISAQQIEQYRSLVKQANKLFGAHHYQQYDFLLVMSDHTGGFGLEHHQSSDDRTDANFLSDEAKNSLEKSLLPHEYVHSWNGKFRRPADLWTPDFNIDMQDDLLWVYEGLTDYYGEVLAARSGMWTPEQYRDSLAHVQASMSDRTGRQWRSLQDTADGWPLAKTIGGSWSDWRRDGDFYPEGNLLWLDVDTQIRALSRDRRSLDDFARIFYGMDNGSYVTRTYTFDDVVAALNAVQPYDWASFLRERLDYTGTQLPEHGVERSGWKLVFNDQPSEFDKSAASVWKGVNLAYSLGLSVNKKGVVGYVKWDGPAFEAGLAPGLKLLAVNGVAYTAEVLKDAVTQAKGSREPIEFMVRNDESVSVMKIDYHGGLRYPHLVREEGVADRLGGIVAALK
jgi:predicted metalloprotease with PDZ domain